MESLGCMARGGVEVTFEGEERERSLSMAERSLGVERLLERGHQLDVTSPVRGGWNSARQVADKSRGHVVERSRH